MPCNHVDKITQWDTLTLQTETGQMTGQMTENPVKQDIKHKSRPTEPDIL